MSCNKTHETASRIFVHKSMKHKDETCGKATRTFRLANGSDVLQGSGHIGWRLFQIGC
jgi:hypothetical protein